MSDLTQRLAQLSPARRRLLARRNPLSFSQRRLWFLDRLYGGSAWYNGWSALRLRGVLGVAALRRTLGELARRHRILHTAFPEVEGEPMQWLEPWRCPALPVMDLGALTPAVAEPLARALALAAGRRPFELGRAPLLRAVLFRFGANDHLLLVAAHHIITDRWSLAVVVAELTALYPAFRAGLPSPLPPPPLQFVDYARWQRRHLTGERLERLLGYWRRQLAGAPGELALPADRPRPVLPSFHGARWTVALRAGLGRAVHELAQRHGASDFMVLLAAFAALLERTTGQRDVLVGSVVAGRERVELEQLVGFFADTLVLRCDLSPGAGGELTGATLLERVRRVVLEAQEHQDLPFERLVEELQPERDLGRNPLFQVGFALHNVPMREYALPELELEEVALAASTARFDLVLAAVERGGELQLEVEHSTELFDRTTVRRLVGHFERLLAGLVAAPGAPLATLPLLSPAERAQLLWQWNDTAVPARAALLSRRVLGQAARQPDAVALTCGRRALSYGQLARRAMRLANLLVEQGVGPEQVVAVCVQRSLVEVVAQLGVLLAGAAFLPVDPALPVARQRFLLRDARVPWVITGGEHRQRLGRLRARWLDVAVLADPWQEAQPGQPAPAVTPRHLAYVIYTSGSSGQPKGVEVTHGGLGNLVHWQQRRRGLGPGDRVPHLSGLAFDATVLELWPALAAGASVHLLSPERSTEGLERWLVRLGITVAMVTTPLLEQLLADGWSSPRGPRQVLTGGDVLHRHPPPGLPFTLTNLYGPTENSVVASEQPVGPVLLPAPRPAIGRPIDNVRVYLLDGRGRLVPAGVPGELVIAGAGLARGYRGRPRRSAESWRPDPFGETPGGRLYRSGDLVRRRADGRLDFLGRRDRQVKLRGLRIELGEVETALLRHPRVREAVVLALPDSAGETRLAAFVVGDGTAPPAVEELCRHLRRSLPESMVPASWELLAALPLNASGKVDRIALGRRGVVPAARAGEDLTPPRDALEEELLALWRQLLPGVALGVRSDFFRLGGHSLLALRLLAAIRKRFGRELPPAVLFTAGTIEALAVELRRRGELPVPASPLVTLAAGAGTPLFLVHPVGGHVLCYAQLARELGRRGHACHGLQALPAASSQSVSSPPDVPALAARYLAALRAVQPAGPYHLGGWSMGGLVAFEMARQLAAEGQPVALLALLDSRAPAPGEAAPLLCGEDLARAFAADLAGLRGVAPALPAPDRADLEALFALFAANYRALHGYAGGHYPGPALLVRASRRPSPASPDLGWTRWLGGPLEVRVLPGDHYALLRPPAVTQLATWLAARLAKSR